MPENEIPWSEVEETAKDLLAEVKTRLADPDLSETQRSNLIQTRDLLIRRIRQNEQGDGGPDNGDSSEGGPGGGGPDRPPQA
jgi:hypothetical protein